MSEQTIPQPLRRWRPLTTDFLESLPRLELESGERLPVEASERLLGRLKTGLGVADGKRLRKLCTQTSLEELVETVFEGWVAAGGPDEGRWIFRGLIAFASDSLVHRLGALISKWAREGETDWAVQGIEVLRRLGTDTALLRLAYLAERAALPSLRSDASNALAQVAGARGLSPEQLEEQLDPDLGLDGRGRRVLELGDRRVVLRLDEALEPKLFSEDGDQLPRFPPKRVSDDERLYSEAKQAWSLLRSTTRTLASTHIQRLERAMCETSTMEREDFVDHVLKSSFMRVLAARLLWRFTGEEEGFFRIAEDGTFADEEDDELELPESCAVGPAHPLHLDDALEVWREVFSDYEILQPFPQLERDWYHWPEGWLESSSYEPCKGWTVSPFRLVALTRRGWREAGAGVIQELRRNFGEIAVSLQFYPGYSRVNLRQSEPAQIDGLTLQGRDDPWFADLDPVHRSEILRDLDSLRETALIGA